MSKNISIQEGGVDKQLTVDKLKTSLVSGGTCLWVPEDETRLGTKHISENGTYKASSDGYYGYSEVTVSGIGSVTGTDPTTGEYVTVTTGSGGEIKTTVLPHSIEVVTPPTVTTFADGASINFDGMVVKAYLKSGEVWTDASHPNGVIPVSELMLPVTQADADSTTGDTASSDLVDGSIPFTNFLTLTQSAEGFGRNYTYENVRTEGLFAVIVGSGSTQILNVETEPGAQYLERTFTYYDDRTVTTHDYNGVNQSYTYNGKTVYFIVANQGWTYDSQSCANASQLTKEVAWTIAYGTVTSGGQIIPVQWMRPGDYSTLESSFNITVI